MTEFQYKTARKFYKQSPGTSTNPESFSKEANLTLYNNQVSQKRNKEPKRYTNTNEIEINKTIDFSDFKSHRKTLSVGKQNEFHPLPEIKIAKNKRGAKKGSFLQVWLNEALDEGQNGQGNQSYLTSINDQTLGALKSYGLDKKMLKSKNISEQTIDKIYKKLYIYTKGLGMTFEEVGKLASSKFPQEGSYGESNAVTEIFWRAFTKLMENQTSFQTAFQTVEKNHLKTIQQLREKIRRIADQFQTHMKINQQQKRKLERQLESQGTKHRQLQTEHNVTKSTLQLTEKTLDQEIQLRLKFEEKINSVYCSYEEIKTKYNGLIEDMRMKREITCQQEENEKSLKQNLEDITVKYKELEHIIDLQRARVRDLQTELVIKNEQRSELQKLMLEKEHLTAQQSDEISQQLQRNKLIYSLLTETKIEKERLQNLLEEEKRISSKFQQRIDQLGELNNKLFSEKYQIHNQGVEIKQKHEVALKQLALKSLKVQILERQTHLLRQEVAQLNDEICHQKTLHKDVRYELEIKTDLLTNSTQTIQKLKEIKDRHQRLQSLAQRDKQQAIQQKITAMAKMQQQQLQIQNLKNEILEKKQQSDIIVSHLNKGKELLTKKLTQLQQQIDRKDKTILTHLNSIQTERIEVLKKQRTIAQLKSKLQNKDNRIFKVESSKLYIQSNQPIIEQKLKQKEQELKTHASKFVENNVKETSLQNKIEEIQALLKVKNQEIHVEIEGYKKLAQFYKQMYNERRDYIHPMIYEDMLGVLGKLSLQIQSYRNQIRLINERNLQREQAFTKLSKDHQTTKHTLQNEKAKNKQLTASNKKLEQQTDNLLTTIKQELNKSLLMVQNQQKLKTEIQLIKTERQQANKQVNVQKGELTELREKMEVREETVKRLEREIDEMGRRYEGTVREIEGLKEKEKQMMEVVSSNRRRESREEAIRMKEIRQQQQKEKEKQEKHTQTDPTSIQPHHPHQISSLPVDSATKNRLRTPPFKPLRSIPEESKEIVQKLLHQTEDQDKKLRPYGVEEKLLNEEQGEEMKGRLDQKERSVSPEAGSKKKVEKRDFQRALRLTFMRR